jgi:DNA-binding NarL/FixJ family response regulator
VPVAQIRLVLASMPPLLGAIVRETLAGQRDIEILAEVADLEQVLTVVRHTGASVAILGSMPDDPRALVHELLTHHPWLHVVMLTSDARTAVVHSLQPRASAIADISPQALLDAIRTAPAEKDVHPRLHPFSPD